MPANITLKMQIGPMVSIQIEGQNCREISDALEGYERLNRQVEDMCSTLAEAVYPEPEGSTATAKGEAS
jgi:N-acetylglutamate synthase/N-acetylornithine aminotransferase